MDRSCLVPKWAPRSACQDCLDFSQDRQRDDLGLFRADVEPHGRMETRHLRIRPHRPLALKVQQQLVRPHPRAQHADVRHRRGEELTEKGAILRSVVRHRQRCVVSLQAHML